MEQLIGQIYFWVCALFAVVGAVSTVTARNPIRGAMGLLLMILCIAGLFLALHAQFLAAIQLIVYAGAIVVLFLFVIMLLGPDATSPRDPRGSITRTASGALFGLTALGIAGFAIRAVHMSDQKLHVPRLPDYSFGGIDEFGRLLFSDWLVPFELSSALLLVAVVGAVAVARGKQGAHEKKVDTSTFAPSASTSATHGEARGPIGTSAREGIS